MDGTLRGRRGPTRRNGHSCSGQSRSRSSSSVSQRADHTGTSIDVALPPERLGRYKNTGVGRQDFWREARNYLLLSMTLFIITTQASWFREMVATPYQYNPTDQREGVHPRVVQYLVEIPTFQVLDPSRSYYGSVDRNLQVSQSEEFPRHLEDGYADPFETEECKAQHPWQLATYPTCNTLHELGVVNPNNSGSYTNRLKILANGYWRDVWEIQEPNPEQHWEDYRYVLKTQRYHHAIQERNFDRNRRDALTAERLTSSPYISDIYGFCGYSCLSEHADGGDVAKAIWSQTHKITKSEELVIATQAAMGLAALHNFDEEGVASVAHTDITPGQFIKVGKTFKLSDFNRARFLRWNVKKDQPCGYNVDRNPGRNRSPEEYSYKVQSEKVDVYSLGNIYYMLLQKEWPFSDVEEKEAKKMIKQGYRPSFDAEVWNSTHPVDQALKEAMIMCHEQEPEDRASARQVETYLKSRLRAIYPNMTMLISDAGAGE